MLSRDFWLGDNGAVTRAVRTWAQTALALITVASFSPFSVGQWTNVVVVSTTAAAVSLLMALDRREALLTPAPATAPAESVPARSAPATADLYAPAAFVDPQAYGCGDKVVR